MNDVFDRKEREVCIEELVSLTLRAYASFVVENLRGLKRREHVER